MRDIFLLLVAAAAGSGCGSSSSRSPETCNVPPPQHVSGDVACQIASSAELTSACSTVCAGLPCVLPAAYSNAFDRLQSPPQAPGDPATGLSPVCPTVDAPVEVTCAPGCF